MPTKTQPKHTPGPLHIIHEPTLSTVHIRIENIDAAPIASLFYSSGGSRPQLGRELVEANAARIVACWNACVGINPEAVPELLAACKTALSALQCNPKFRENETTINALGTALAKAEGQP